VAIDIITQRLDQIEKRIEEAQRSRELLHDRLSAAERATGERRETVTSELYQIRLLVQQNHLDIVAVKTDLAQVKANVSDQRDVAALKARLDGMRVFIIAIITPVVTGIVAAVARVAYVAGNQ
jgi:hypothetical protein